MAKASDSSLKFWGVRGSIPTPGPENIGFGGNTACIELRSQGEIFIIDGGTGARRLGLCLQERFPEAGFDANILLTHFHWDHIQGLPFFAPLYDARNEVTLYSSCQPEELRSILNYQMATPYFPVNFACLAAARKFVELDSGGQRTATAVVRPFPMNHPQGATGFRIELSGGAVVTHASDLEHGNPKLDKVLREYAQDADVLIYDAQYTPEEYERREGWGHSTWLEATRIARQCNVKRLILFHHDPSHNDEQIMRIESEARLQFEKTDAAKEGWEVYL
jgi:phosphoribosyl 1,2-cyclic phosphodiesterase